LIYLLLLLISTLHFTESEGDLDIGSQEENQFSEKQKYEEFFYNRAKFSSTIVVKKGKPSKNEISIYLSDEKHSYIP
jgi:hypothetical protein